VPATEDGRRGSEEAAPRPISRQGPEEAAPRPISRQGPEEAAPRPISRQGPKEAAPQPIGRQGWSSVELIEERLVVATRAISESGERFHNKVRKHESRAAILSCHACPAQGTIRGYRLSHHWVLVLRYLDTRTTGPASMSSNAGFLAINQFETPAATGTYRPRLQGRRRRAARDVPASGPGRVWTWTALYHQCL
jgi:hypothetical protein